MAKRKNKFEQEVEKRQLEMISSYLLKEYNIKVFINENDEILCKPEDSEIVDNVIELIGLQNQATLDFMYHNYDELRKYIK